MTSNSDLTALNDAASRLNSILLPIGPNLSPLVHRMAVAAERSGSWSLDGDPQINRSSVPTVDSIKDNGDLSDMFAVMLSIWKPGSPPPDADLREIGLDRRFVSKIRSIRNVCAHPFSGDHRRQLSDPAWFRDSEKAARDFAEMASAVASRTQVSKPKSASGPTGPRVVDVPPAPAREWTGLTAEQVREQAAPRRRSRKRTTDPPLTLDGEYQERTSRSTAEARGLLVQAETAPHYRPTRRRPFLLRPEFWALAAGAVAAVGLDFWGYSGVPESGEVWKAPLTMTGIVFAGFALFSGLMSGRAVRVNAVLSLMLLPVMVFLFALYLSEKADSDGFYVLLGTVTVFWGAVTALIPLIAIVSFLGDFRIVR